MTPIARLLASCLAAACMIAAPVNAADRLASAGTAPVAAAQSGPCGRTDVLSSIVHRFDYTAANALKSDIAIVEIRGMHLRRFVLKDRKHLVGREYCGATALTSDGVVRPMWYLIEHDFAFAGTGSKVEYCLAGLDPTYAYGAHCASLK